MTKKRKLKVSAKKPQQVLRHKDRKESPQHISAKTRAKTATVKKRLAPPALATLIGLVNKVPDGLLPLRDLRLICGGNQDDLDVTVWNETARFTKSLRAQIPSPPDKDDHLAHLQWISGGRAEGQRSRVRLYYCYNYAVEGRIALGAVADKDGMSIGPFYLEHHLDEDSEGKLKIHPHPILDALQYVERKRIRRCPICKKIYWAERIDQPTCTKQCNNVRRSRIQRGTFSRPEEEA